MEEACRLLYLCPLLVGLAGALQTAPLLSRRPNHKSGGRPTKASGLWYSATAKRILCSRVRLLLHWVSLVFMRRGLPRANKVSLLLPLPLLLLSIRMFDAGRGGARDLNHMHALAAAAAAADGGRRQLLIKPEARRFHHRNIDPPAAASSAA